MSKTMDNDYLRYAALTSTDDHVTKLNAEIERLKAALHSEQILRTGADLSSQWAAKEVNTLRARVEELEAKNMELCKTLDRWQDQFREERQAAKLHPNTVGYLRIKEERDQLRAELEVVREHSDDVIKRNRELSAELEALKPKPVLVKRTWQAVHTDDEYNNPEMKTHKAAVGFTDPGTSIAVLRRDHYSDGTVVATLEKIGE